MIQDALPVAEIAVIGGSGLYELDSLEDRSERVVTTPYGPTSDPVRIGRLEGIQVAFVARHGRGHRLIPSEVPYRANIHALRSLGVRYLLSVSAVGSLQESIRPLDVVVPDQFIDLTRRRDGTFFGDGAVAHVSMADPVCSRLADILVASAGAAADDAVRVHAEGTYVCIEGPAFSTRAESRWFRSMRADVIGMTAMPEARLAREAGMAYGLLALVTDYDCWHPREAYVTAELALTNLAQNAERARRMIAAAVRTIAGTRPASVAHRALDSALVTSREQMSVETRLRLQPLLE